MHGDQTKPTRRSESSHNPFPVLLIVVALLTVYVMSYPVAVRIAGGWTFVMVPKVDSGTVTARAPVCGTTSLPYHRPVDWLIDHTPLKDPLFAWAGVWGVDTQFREAVLWR